MWGVDDLSCLPARPDFSCARILPIHNNKLPFPDDYFDLVTSNMVFEHVADLQAVLAEMRRVLRPTGSMLHLFPLVEVWKEGHCAVPFAHRFNRYSYLLAARYCGLGAGKQDVPDRREWARHWSRWLKEKCFYRSNRDVIGAFAAHGFTVEHIERAYIAYRAARTSHPLRFIPGALFRRLAFSVLRCTVTDPNSKR